MLHIASEAGFEDIASYLIAQGAPLHLRNSRGLTAHELALRGEYEDIALMIESALDRLGFV